MSLPVTVILPSLNPDEKLLEVVEGVAQAGFSRLILVNDGSSTEHQPFFEQAVQLAEKSGVQTELLCHAKNLGKGRALKTAFNRYLCCPGDSVGVVTVDGDNQHKKEDILRCAQALAGQPDTIFLGCRDFSLPDIPPRSRFGNKLTSLIFRAACGMKLSDTQTGLRAIPNACLLDFLDLAGERFEFETNMLLEMKQKEMLFQEIPISTVYLEENRSSHFRPLADSLRILRVLFRYMLSAGASFVLDLGLFTALSFLFRGLPLQYSVFLSTILARLVSSAFNFSVNKNLVFQSHGNVRKVAVRYYLLCVVQMLCSASLVWMLLEVLGRGWSVPAKLLVDVLLFFISFWIQREWVFRG